MHHAQAAQAHCSNCSSGSYSSVRAAACTLCLGYATDPYSVTTVIRNSTTQECICNPGYFLGSSGGCKKCVPGQFKAQLGDASQCRECREHSKLGCAGASSCQCEDGYSLHRDVCVQDTVDCIGAWHECSPDCFKVYKVSTVAAAGGAECAVKHLEPKLCEPGEGNCPLLSATSGPQCIPNVQIVSKDVRVEIFTVRVEYIYRDLGCDGVPGSGAKLDACTVCGGDNQTCTDCAGIVNGGARLDRCGSCSSGLAGAVNNSTCQDCAGLAQGSNWEDMCGTCDSNRENDCKIDCAGIWPTPANLVKFGQSSVDSCGVCAGSNACVLCKAGQVHPVFTWPILCCTK